MSNLFLAELNRGLHKLNQVYSPKQMEQFCEFLSLMQEWNRVMNLTAITKPSQMVMRHIIDSLAITPYVNGSAVLDVGTGAGLPGIPLSIALPDKTFTLLDKSNKKIQFLRHVKQVLGLDNVNLLCERVESLTDISFPCIVSRAFAKLDKLIDSSGHLVADRGRILAMTGELAPELFKSLPAQWYVEEQVLLDIPDIEKDHFLILLEKNTKKEGS